MRLVLKTQDRKQELADFGWTMAQIPAANSSPLKIADIRAVDLFVYDKADPSTVLYSTGIAIPLTNTGGCFSDVLRLSGDTPPPNQPSVPWQEDSRGCNFAHYLYQGVVFVDPITEAGGHTYRLEYRINTYTSGLIWVVRESTTSSIISSGGGGSGPPPPTPDFALAITSSNSQTIQQGSPAEFDFSIAPQFGFSADVTLSVGTITPTITGLGVAFVPNPVVGGNGSTVLSLNTNSSTTLPNVYTIPIIATGGGITHSTSITLSVTSIGGGGTGWTNFTATSNTIIHYVSSSTGNDANDGLTPATAFATPGHGLQSLRNNKADWLLFACGDTWNTGITAGASFITSGISQTEPILISSYVQTTGPNAGSVVRPKFNSGTLDGINLGNGGTPYINNVAIVGLHFFSDGNLDGRASPDGDCSGIYWPGQSVTYALIEDCKVEGYQQNIVVQRTPDPAPTVGDPLRVTPDSTWMSGILIRRNVIIDAHCAVGVNLFDGNGIYTAWCNGIIVEENILEHNGWRQDMRGSYQGFNRHNVYMQNSIHNAVIRGNVSTETDMQMRGGGICENNLLLNNYIGLQFGLGSTTGDDPHGVFGTVQGNVMLGGSNVGDGLRLIHQASWDEPSLTLTVLDPVNPWAGLVADALVGYPAASGSEEGVSINFHCSGGTGTVPDVNTFAGRRIVHSTANTLTLNRTIGAGANGHNDITGWTTFGTAQGSRGKFMYAGNIASANVLNNIIANQYKRVAGKNVSDGPQPPGQSADVFDLASVTTGDAIGCKSMIFAGNKIYNWMSDSEGMPVNFTGGYFLRVESDNPGNSKYSGNVLSSNEFTNNLTGDAIARYAFSNGQTGFVGSGGTPPAGNNHLWTAQADPNKWFELPAQSSLATWKAGMVPADTTSSASPTTYTNVNADITSYLTQLSDPNLGGIVRSYQGYTDAIRSMSKNMPNSDSFWQKLIPTNGAGNVALGPLAYFRAAFS